MSVFAVTKYLVSHKSIKRRNKTDFIVKNPLKLDLNCLTWTMPQIEPGFIRAVGSSKIFIFTGSSITNKSSIIFFGLRKNFEQHFSNSTVSWRRKNFVKKINCLFNRWRYTNQGCLGYSLKLPKWNKCTSIWSCLVRHRGKVWTHQFKRSWVWAGFYPWKWSSAVTATYLPSP